MKKNDGSKISTKFLIIFSVSVFLIIFALFFLIIYFTSNLGLFGAFVFNVKMWLVIAAAAGIYGVLEQMAEGGNPKLISIVAIIFMLFFIYAAIKFKSE